MDIVNCRADGTMTLPTGQEVQLLGQAKNPLMLMGYGILGNMVMTMDAEKIICHECGGAFRSLSGCHLQIHGLTSYEYRVKYGLYMHTRLSAPNTVARRRDHVMNSKGYKWIMTNGTTTPLEKNNRLQNSESHKRNRRSYAHRNKHGTCPAQLKARLEQIAHEHGVPPHEVRVEMCKSFFQTLRTWFPTWNEAKSALLAKPLHEVDMYRRKFRTPVQWTDEKIIQSIHTFIAKEKRMPFASDFRSSHLLPDPAIIYRRFGSLNALRAQVGLPQIRAGWFQKPKIAP